jgi:molybdopterin-guanine dinucleotide biosynthesis protein A
LEWFKTAAILAGGKSTRMGFDKSMLKIEGVFLSEVLISNLKKIFGDIVVVTNNKKFYQKFDVRIVSDQLTGGGPLNGFHAGLKASLSYYTFFIACDMPFLSIPYIKYMMKLLSNFKADAAVSEKEGNIEPFQAFYSKDIIENIEESYKKGNLMIKEVLKDLKVIKIREEKLKEFSPKFEIFTNLNRPEDIMKLNSIVKGEGEYNGLILPYDSRLNLRKN